MVGSAYISAYTSVYLEDDFITGKQEPPYYSALKDLIKNSKLCQ